MTPSAALIADELASLLPRLRRFARTLARHREDADDLVQAAVEKALGRAEQWLPGTRLDSWMFRIMQNTWIDEMRARQRRGDVFAPEEAGEHIGHDPTAAREDALAVRAAMARLPEDQRAAVSLVLIEGLPYAEAAEVLDVPVGTLTSRLARGRAAMMALLEGSSA